MGAGGGKLPGLSFEQSRSFSALTVIRRTASGRIYLMQKPVVPDHAAEPMGSMLNSMAGLQEE
jgi:hypothetical protein